MTDKKPLAWIRLKLTPLFDADERTAPAIVFWQPEAGLLTGPDAGRIQALIDQAQARGFVENSRGERIPIDDPLRNTAQLSAILSQHFWVAPQPVSQPDEVDGDGIMHA